jgi:hypothetical protein
MPQQKKPKPQPVSTIPILREIEKALKKISQKEKRASFKVKEELALEMKILKRCKEDIHDIEEC